MTATPKPRHSPLPWAFEYSPYRRQNGRDGPENELPAFEVFDHDGNKVFDTNEDAPAQQQEANALIAVTASEMAELLQSFAAFDTLAKDCREWKREQLDPLFQRAQELLARIAV